jgi:hypothetical protein
MHEEERKKEEKVFNYNWKEEKSSFAHLMMQCLYARKIKTKQKKSRNRNLANASQQEE